MSYYSNRNRGGLARWHVAAITFALTCLLLGENPIDVVTGLLPTTTTPAEATAE